MQPSHNMQQSYQIQQMQKAQQMRAMMHMKKLKEMQQMKHIERVNAIEKNMSLEQKRNAVIKPINLKDKKANIDVEKNYINIKSGYVELPKKKNKAGKKNKSEKTTKLMEDMWKSRTNDPYKSVLKSAKILKDDDYNKTFKSKKELIIHKVTDADRDQTILESDLNEKQGNIEKHNDELKMIYSLSKEAENKQKFEYNRVYRSKNISKDHGDLKKNKIAYYMKKQKEENRESNKIDSIIKMLAEESKDNSSEDINFEALHEKMKEEYGEEYERMIEEVEKEENKKTKKKGKSKRRKGKSKKKKLDDN
jgi:hypothetical protein